MSWGRTIRDGRVVKQWTQGELAERVRTSTTTISNWEREVTKPGIDDINPICMALNLSPDFFCIELGILLTPPAAAKLPIGLVQAALRLSPRSRDDLERHARALIALEDSGEAPPA